MTEANVMADLIGHLIKKSGDPERAARFVYMCWFSL